MSNCPWSSLNEHKSPDGSCSLVSNDDYTMRHTFFATQYSTEPEHGTPIVNEFEGLSDGVTLSRFGLNKRLCSVEVSVAPQDVHIMSYSPTSGYELWSLVESVLTAWNNFNTAHSYWPSRSTCVDSVIDRAENTIRHLRPVRFQTEAKQYCLAISVLIRSLFKNYYARALDDPGELADRTVRMRRVECNYAAYAMGFWEQYDRERFDTFEKGTKEMTALRCRLKRLFDSMFTERQKHTDHQLAKRIFHAVADDVFGDHKDYAHMVLCKDFVLEHNSTCVAWLKFIHTFTEYRMRRAAAGDDDDDEEMRTSLRSIIKEWRNTFLTTQEIERLRMKEATRRENVKRRIDVVSNNKRSKVSSTVEEETDIYSS